VSPPACLVTVISVASFIDLVPSEGSGAKTGSVKTLYIRAAQLAQDKALSVPSA
jgi:hypothetical protein